MREISTIIVDDEPLALRGLELRLQNFDDIKIIEKCKNGREAIKAIKALKPDLVFLDIQMPGYDGFAVIKALIDIEPPIFVFVTAFDRYAVNAFETHVFDYLLKPVDDDRLSIAVSRVRNQLNQQQAICQNTKLLELINSLDSSLDMADILASTATKDTLYEDRISIKDNNQTILLDVDHIDWIDAAGDYLCLHAKGETHILRETMKRITRRLDPAKFQRVHRSVIINIARVSKIESNENGQQFLILTTGNKIKISRHYKEVCARFL